MSAIGERNMKGVAVSLGSFVANEEPFANLESITEWAASIGFRGISLPTHDSRLFTLVSASDEAYIRIVNDLLFRKNLKVVELSVEQQTRSIAAHPAYDAALDALAPAEVRDNRNARAAWAAEQVWRAAFAARQLGATQIVAVSGSLVWPYLVAGPARPAGIVETGFAELARRWTPLLDHCDSLGVDVCFALEPGQDVHDGATWGRFLSAINHHRRARLVYDPGRLLLQQIDYVELLGLYSDRVGAFHASDAEVVPNGRQSIFGSFDEPHEQIARRRTLGDGQIDIAAVFETLARIRFEGWATLDWACTIRDPREGAVQSFAVMEASLIKPRPKPAKASAAPPQDEVLNRRILGLD